VSKAGKNLGTVTAAKRFYPSQNMPTTESGIKNYGLSQLYIAPGDVNNNGLVLHIWWKPEVVCIWLGAIFMMIGGLFSLSDRRLRVGAPQRALTRSKKSRKGA